MQISKSTRQQSFKMHKQRAIGLMQELATEIHALSMYSTLKLSSNTWKVMQRLNDQIANVKISYKNLN